MSLLVSFLVCVVDLSLSWISGVSEFPRGCEGFCFPICSIKQIGNVCASQILSASDKGLVRTSDRAIASAEKNTGLSLSHFKSLQMGISTVSVRGQIYQM